MVATFGRCHHSLVRSVHDHPNKSLLHKGMKRWNLLPLVFRVPAEYYTQVLWKVAVLRPLLSIYKLFRRRQNGALKPFWHQDDVFLMQAWSEDPSTEHHCCSRLCNQLRLIA
eukprot:6481316-Amphidinium_carterae.2